MNEILCQCRGVTKSKVLELKNKGCTVEDVINTTRVTTGCYWCNEEFKDIMNS